MNNPTKTTPPEDPEEQEAMREIAEEREEKYGGRDRWILTGVFVIAAIGSVWQFSRKQPLALFFFACTVLAAVLAILNWRSWFKKSPAQRMAVPPAISLKGLEIKDCSAPFTEAQFSSLRQAFQRNLAIAVLAFMFALPGLMAAAMPHHWLSLRVIGLAMAGLAITLGYRPAQRVWRAGKGALACPKCHDLLTSQASHVLRTGHCKICGALILSDASVADAPVETAPDEEPSRRSSQASWPSNSKHPVKYDSGRVFDTLTLLSVPTFCAYYFGWNSFGQGGRLLIGFMLLVIAACFCFMPDKLLGYESSSRSHSKRGKKTIEPPSETNTSQPASVPFLDFAVMLLFPLMVIIGLCYLIWTHRILTQLELALLTVSVPGAIVLVSYFVVRHEGHHVKKTGKPASDRFLWSIIALWVMAVFIFVVCLVNLIQKFWLKW